MARPAFAFGDPVTITTPGNPLADGKPGRVAALADWGCHLATAFGSGAFRAAWHEMIPDGPADPPPVRTPARPRTPAPLVAAAVGGGQGQARASGYTGDECGRCQGLKMRRNGACTVCEDCGDSSGCG